MTDEQRIEAGRAAFIKAQGPRPIWFPSLENIAAVLAAAYPELHSDPPTHVVAPIEPTKEMQDATLVANMVRLHGEERLVAARDLWRHMARSLVRTAHLAKDQ